MSSPCAHFVCLILFGFSTLLSLLSIFSPTVLSFLLAINFIFHDAMDKFPVHFSKGGPWHPCRVRPSHRKGGDTETVSSAVFSSLSVPVFFPCLSLSLSLSLYLSLSLSISECCCGRVVVSCCVLCCGVCVCGVVCSVVCVVWHAEIPVCPIKTSVCTFKNVPVYAGTTGTCVSTCARAHVFQHVRVVPVHTGTFLNVHTGTF